MNRCPLVIPSVFCASVIGALPVVAQKQGDDASDTGGESLTEFTRYGKDTADGKLPITAPPLEMDPERLLRHRFSLGVKALSGIEVTVGNLGAWQSTNRGTLSLAGGTDRTYDDGYNRVDSSGNDGGETWNWGYESDSQYNPAADAIEMSIYGSDANVSHSENEFAPGFQLSYGMILGDFSIADHKGTWGLETSFSFVRMESIDTISRWGDATRTIDSFALNGVIPPLGPYSGSFSGPGALLSDHGIRSESVLANGALINASRELDTNIATFGLGPFVEIPLSESVSLEAGLGLSVGVIDSDFSVNQLVSISGVGAQAISAKDAETAARWGAYAKIGLSAALTENVSLIVAGRWEYLESFGHNAGPFSVDYSFDQAVSGMIGLSFRF